MLYSELQCSEAIHKAVERMGFAEMTEVQEKTIPVMLAGRDVIAKAPTGTGKTCAFGIPVAEHIDPALKAPQAVILAPTRELAQQIAEELTGLTYFMPEVQVVCVYGGANMEKQAKRLAEGCQIVVATPGRLMDHYKHHNIDLDHVTQVVLDEADEMLNMGFYKDVKHIIGLMKARKSLSMFSATISREVMDIGWMYQKDAEEITVQPKEESQPKITQYMLETSGRNKLSDLAQIIIGEGYKRVMVFCDTKFNTATLANQLARLGYRVSGWSRSEKQLAGVTCYRGEEALDSFLGSLDGLINLLPLTAQTRGILAAPLFSRLPAGAVLINCGRGEHMVNEDVLAALESGQLAGAVLDVFPQEPLPADDPLWRHPQVVITPHMASAASAEVIARQLLENIQRQRRGLPLKNLVNKHAGY